MKKIDKANRLDMLATKLLNRLGILSPDKKQMDYAIVILSIMEIFPEELQAEELLSQQEFECFYWAINGYSQAEIAKLMDISRETVKGYLDRIKNKYHSKTITQALYKGIKYNSLKRNYESIRESLQEIAEGIILLMNEIK